MINRSREEILDRLRRYGTRYELASQKELGFGWDGIVFSTNLQTALKGFAHQRLYERERDVYQRLLERHVVKVGQFKVPQFIRCDDELWIVEMSIVSPPFVLDFAGAYLDQAPDYPADVMSEWLAEKQEQFGERWSKVAGVMTAFRQWGVWLADVKPGKVEFGSLRDIRSLTTSATGGCGRSAFVSRIETATFRSRPCLRAVRRGIGRGRWWRCGRSFHSRRGR